MPILTCTLHTRQFCKLLVVLLLFSFAGLTKPVNAQNLGDLTNRFVSAQPLLTEVAGKQKSTVFAVSGVEGSFNGIVLRGRATGNYRNGYVRFNDETGWTEWQPLLYLETDTYPLFFAGYRGDVFWEDVQVQLRFDVESIDTIEVLEIGVFDNREDDDAIAMTDAPAIALPAVQSAIVPPTLISRAEWGASSFNGNPVPLAQPSYTRMTFHHAAGFKAQTYEEGKAQVKAIQDFHQNVRGWSDIGYQFVFDQQGRLYQGRPFLDNNTTLDSPPILAQGAHVGGANTGNIGVSLLGCYHPPEGNNCQDIASPALIDSVLTLYAYLSEQYRVDVSNLFGHRDQTATACPGDNNYERLPEFRDRIRALIVAGNQPIAAGVLTADPDESGVVKLSWEFTEIVDVESYRIERSTGQDTVTVFETSDLTAIRTLDPALPGGGAYEYHLLAQSSTGREQRLSSTLILVEQPEGFTLEPGFPNPAITSSTIRYYLEHEGIVRLNIYNTNGQLIKTLVEEFQDGDRWHAVGMDTRDLASGMYFVRLVVEGFSDVAYDKTRTIQVIR